MNSEMKCIICGKGLFNYKEKYCNKHYVKYVLKPALKQLKKRKIK